MNPGERGGQKRCAVFWLFVGREPAAAGGGGGGGTGVWRRGRGGGAGVIRGGAGGEGGVGRSN